MLSVITFCINLTTNGLLFNWSPTGRREGSENQTGLKVILILLSKGLSIVEFNPKYRPVEINP